MKNIFKILIIPFLILSISACDEEGKDFLESSLVTSPEFFPGQGGMVSLNAETPSSTAITLNWMPADYGQNVQIDYAVYISPTSEFTTSEQIANTTTTTASWTVATINSHALNFGLAPDVEGTLYIKVESSIGNPATMIGTSQPISITIIPYNTYNFKDYFLVGNATEAGWNNNSNNPALIRDPENSNSYWYTGRFVKGVVGDINEGRWKVLEMRGAWQPQWGVTANEGSDDIIAAGDIAGNPGTQSGDPGRFGVETDGYYTFKINFAEMNFTIEAFDATTSPVYPTIGIIGDATPTGWDSDTDLTQLSIDPHIWTIQDFELGTGEVKFRANDAWDVSWGSTTYYSGTGTIGGENIPVFGGVYDIWFNDLTGDYIMIPNEE